MPDHKIRVTIWNEGRHEKRKPEAAAIYPKGIHGAIADHLKQAGGFSIRIGVLDDPQHGLNADVVNDTDVMLWWGHLHHKEVADEVVDRVVYFRPGHETFPSYHDKNVLRIIENAVRWAAPTRPPKPVEFGKRVRGWIDER